MYFQYGTKELDHLRAKDQDLAQVIDQVGPIQRAVIPDLFMALVHAIIGQQISTKAHQTVWERAQTMFVPLTPTHLATLAVAHIQSCGISMRKAGYIRAMAQKIALGELDLKHLQTLDDEAVCARLCTLHGVGVWTAEMLMTFSMQRMNILSWGDLAIQRGLRMLYRHRRITPPLFAKYKRRYTPYATVASLYLWALAGGACPGYTDPEPKKIKTQGQLKKTR